MTPKKRIISSRFQRIDRRTVIGRAKTDHGTRVCQRIECQRCKKTDYIAIKVSGNKERFCRDCAETILGRFDQGRHISKLMVVRTCHQCLKEFSVSEAVAQKKEQLACVDCHRGFDVWRGKVKNNTAPGSIERTVIKTGINTKLRKGNNDTI